MTTKNAVETHKTELYPYKLDRFKNERQKQKLKLDKNINHLKNKKEQIDSIVFLA